VGDLEIAPEQAADAAGRAAVLRAAEQRERDGALAGRSRLGLRDDVGDRLGTLLHPSLLNRGARKRKPRDLWSNQRRRWREPAAFPPRPWMRERRGFAPIMRPSLKSSKRRAPAEGIASTRRTSTG